MSLSVILTSSCKIYGDILQSNVQPRWYPWFSFPWESLCNRSHQQHTLEVFQWWLQLQPLLSCSPLQQMVFYKLCFQDTSKSTCFSLFTWAWLVDITYDVGHSSFKSQKCSQMNRLPRIIFGERFHLSSMAFTSLFGHKPKMAMTRSRELTVRL